MFIATAAPEKLANVLLESINLDVQIIGTPLQKKLRGWTSGIHCRSEEKVRRLDLLRKSLLQVHPIYQCSD